MLKPKSGAMTEQLRGLQVMSQVLFTEQDALSTDDTSDMLILANMLQALDKSPAAVQCLSSQEEACKKMVE